MAFTIDQLGKIESAIRHLADLTPEEFAAVCERLAEDDVDKACSMADAFVDVCIAEQRAQTAADSDDDGPVRRRREGDNEAWAMV